MGGVSQFPQRDVRGRVCGCLFVLGVFLESYTGNCSGRAVGWGLQWEGDAPGTVQSHLGTRLL